MLDLLRKGTFPLFASPPEPFIQIRLVCLLGVDLLHAAGGPCRARRSHSELRFESANTDGASAQRRSGDLAFPISAGRPAREFIFIGGGGEGGWGVAAAGCQRASFNKERRGVRPKRSSWGIWAAHFHRRK